MAIRIGRGPSAAGPSPARTHNCSGDYVDAAETLDVDSLWLSDRVVSSVVSMEPLIALSFVAARTTKLKFGTSVLALPLRNPTLLAKEIATLDFLSGGRVLPAVGLGTEEEREFEACGSARSQRAGRTDEAIEVMRRLWSEDDVTFHGRYFTLNGVTVQPKPVQAELPPLWIGGRSDRALRRVGQAGRRMARFPGDPAGGGGRDREDQRLGRRGRQGDRGRPLRRPVQLLFRRDPPGGRGDGQALYATPPRTTSTTGSFPRSARPTMSPLLSTST